MAETKIDLQSSTGMTPSIVLLVVGLAVGARVFWQFWTGYAYTYPFPQRVHRSVDPFSFWTSVLPWMLVAALLIVAGVGGIVMALTK
jgi:hypothetical protein